MRLDGDITTAAIDARRNVVGTDPFTIGVVITRDTDPFQGYEWNMQLPPSGLAFVPGSFRNLSAGTFPQCGTPTDVGGNQVYGGCLKDLPMITYTGPVAAIDLRCAADGVFTIELLDLYHTTVFSTDLLDSDAHALPTHTVGMTVNCSGTGVQH